MPPMAFRGIVTSVGKMRKTATVTVNHLLVHPRTKKQYEKRKKFLTHDPEEVLRLDDEVLIRNCPPVSARKRFALEKILRSPEGDRDVRHVAEGLALGSNATDAGAATATASS